MNEEQRLVYVEGRLLEYRITLESMLVANKQREINGESLAYSEESFVKLIEEYVNHNCLITEILGY